MRIRLQSERKGERTSEPTSGQISDTPAHHSGMSGHFSEGGEGAIKVFAQEEQYGQVTRTGVPRVDKRDGHQAPRVDKGLANAAEVWCLKKLTHGEKGSSVRGEGSKIYRSWRQNGSRAK